MHDAEVLEVPRANHKWASATGGRNVGNSGFDVTCTLIAMIVGAAESCQRAIRGSRLDKMGSKIQPIAMLSDMFRFSVLCKSATRVDTSQKIDVCANYSSRRC